MSRALFGATPGAVSHPKEMRGQEQRS